MYKKNRRLIGLFVSLVIIFLLYNCKQEIGPTLSGGGDNALGTVKNIKVKNIPGGAHIFYTLPKSIGMSYVKAVYFTKNGKQEVKASHHRDSLTVKGFAKASAHKVKLYSYSQGGNRSNPVTVSINPLIPPFKKVFNTISLQNNFGGVKVDYGGNETEAPLAIAIVVDSLGEVLPIQNNYISKQKGTYSLRGLKSRTYKLGYYVRDEYQNRSDTTYKSFKPLFEKELNRDKFSNAKLPTDFWQNPSFGNFRNIWDGESSVTKGDGNWWSRNVESMPIWITIDLGQKTKISRISLYGEKHYALYTNAYPKKFELWGSSNPNINDGKPFDSSWFKYGTFETKPPTGVIADDMQIPYPQNGVVYPISDASTFPFTRYLRIKVLASWSGERRMAIGDLDIYGSPKK